jgi:endonuclease/exonuclease/phosphatase family metal-dependent hydrolase
MALHPHVPGRLDYYRKHKRHLDRLLTLRNQAPNLVIMGDLNTCPYTARMAKIIGALEAYDTRTGLGPLPTWSRWIPFLPIDYVICSKNIRVRQLQTTPAAGSDHLTIIADLEVPI